MANVDMLAKTRFQAAQLRRAIDSRDAIGQLAARLDTEGVDNLTIAEARVAPVGWGTIDAALFKQLD